MESVRVDCNSKINLFLRILGRRDDGYHDIETVFHSVGLHDTLHLSPARAGISVACDDSAVPLDDSNTALRAARLILQGTGKGLRIDIEKRIPVGAGMGGGSADAAGVLVGANVLYGLGLKVPDLERMARTVGADVAFLVRGGCAAGAERGDRLEYLPPLTAMPLVLVIPPLSISSSWAYASIRMGLTTRESQFSMIKCALERGDSASLFDLLENDFESLVFERYPSVGAIKKGLIEAGAEGALMTGSGPVVFGVFAKEGDAKARIGRFLNEGHKAILSRLASNGVTVTW
jgi:4-diphosphocytidyl-2-C-methyl-D-erythritol kinase